MVTFVTVYLDDNVPEYMLGIIRCGTVISVDEDGNETDHQEIIDNREFHSEEDLVEDVAKRLRVDKSIVEIIG